MSRDHLRSLHSRPQQGIPLHQHHQLVRTKSRLLHQFYSILSFFFPSTGTSTHSLRLRFPIFQKKLQWRSDCHHSSDLVFKRRSRVYGLRRHERRPGCLQGLCLLSAETSLLGMVDVVNTKEGETRRWSHRIEIG